MKAKRFLALLLVLCLSVSLFALPVSADEYNTFSSFTELKSLVKKYKDSTEYTMFEYVGTETLTIKEDISIPQNIGLACVQQPLTVPKGVTLDVAGNLVAGTMTVKGTANVMALDIIEALTVTGKLNIGGQLYCYSTDVKLSGEENITLGEYAGIYFSCQVTNMSELTAAAKAAAADTNEKHHYTAYIDTKLTINKSVTIPANMALTFAKAVTVSSGVKLTVNGEIDLYNTATVKGSLVNNGVIYILNVKEYDFIGKLKIADSGSYSGNGIIAVYSPDIEEPADIISGINLKNFEVTEQEEYDQWVIFPKEETEVQVTAPKVTAANTASTGKVKLSWKEIEGAEKYIVYRATSKSGKYTKLKTTTKLAYTDSSAKVGTTYYYKVKAVGASSDNTATSSAVKGVRDLARPTVTAKNTASTGKTKLSWDAVSGAEKYVVYRATSKNGEYTKVKTTTSTSYTDSSAKVGKTYYYKVVAVHEKSAANSAKSKVVSGTRDLARPTASVKVNSDGDPKVSWEKVSGAKKYYVYRATSKDGEYTRIKSTTKASYTDTSAKAGKTYYYKVKAIHSISAANSASSAVVKAKAK